MTLYNIRYKDVTLMGIEAETGREAKEIFYKDVSVQYPNRECLGCKDANLRNLTELGESELCEIHSEIYQRRVVGGRDCAGWLGD